MGLRGSLLGLILLATFTSSASAQNQERTSTTIGDASSKPQSYKANITAKGCATIAFNNEFAPSGFTYTAALGLAALPAGCDEKVIRVLKQYTYGTCPKTRANNYPVQGLGITNTCTDGIKNADEATCKNVFAQAPPEAFAAKGIGAGSIIDTGNVCWNPPQVFYFVENGCSAPISATIKLTSNAYTGPCTNAADTDDGGDDAGGPGSTTESKKSSKSGLSSGAKAGIAIGVIAAVVLIAVAIWFFCCQIRG